MNIGINDTEANELLYPFTAVRSAIHIRVGILTIKERWEKLTGSMVELGNGSQSIGANILSFSPGIDALPAADTVKTLQTAADLFRLNDWALRKDFELITAGRTSAALSSTNSSINPGQIFLEEGAKVEYCILNASGGPIYIGRNAEIMEGSMIRGPFALGENSVVKMGAKIYGGTSIGPHCIASGEIKNSILMGYSNKAHDGYLGDSVLGYWCNLGAGTTNSNLKNTAGTVLLWNNSSKSFTPSGNKCGLLMGDYSRSAINTSFNTGTVVGCSCNIFAEGFPSKYIPDFTWGKERYLLEKALADIDNWKKLKGGSITDEEITALTNLYNKTINE